MKKLTTFFALISLLFSVNSFADGGFIPGLVGEHSTGGVVYVGVQNNKPGCKNGGIYFYGKDMKMALSIATSAKLAGKTLRIDFNQPDGVGGMCEGSGIFIE